MKTVILLLWMAEKVTSANPKRYRALQNPCRRSRPHLHLHASRARDETSPHSRVRAVVTSVAATHYAPNTSAQVHVAATTQRSAWAHHARLLAEHLGVLRGFQRDGTDATLRHLNLSRLAGRPVADLFLGLTDVICPDGGAIDEGMARDAWLETVIDLGDLGIDDTA